MTRTRNEHRAMGALWAGLVLTVLATVVPYVDRATANVLAHHLQAGYPTYPQGRIDAGVRTYLIYLSTVGALGVGCWAYVIRAVKLGRRWRRTLATLGLALGGSIALLNLLVRDTSGDTGLPPLLGWVGMLPALAGVVAVALLWRRPLGRPQ